MKATVTNWRNKPASNANGFSSRYAVKIWARMLDALDSAAEASVAFSMGDGIVTD